MSQLSIPIQMPEPQAGRSSLSIYQPKIRPILFTAPMVLANLKGIKTQTRRTNEYWLSRHFIQDGFQLENVRPINGFTHAVFRWKTPLSRDSEISMAKCPYGQPGDILYGRETLYCDTSNDWRYRADNELVMVDAADELDMVVWAHHKETNNCASIHMPRFASRQWMEIKDIRLERVRSISKADAIAEGIDIFKQGHDYMLPIKNGHFRERNPVYTYLALFNQINGTTMQDNPWVWVIDYSLISKPLPIN